VLKDLIHKLVDGQDLTEGEMIDAMEAIMGGEATQAQMAAFLTALRVKGETVEEITGAARVMREHVTPIRAEGTRASVVSIDRDEINVDHETIIDTCGTGGSGTNTFNISTTTAFVLAGAGLRVAKHGNRAVSSRCGSADVLEALGVNLDVTPQIVEECLREIGIGFLYAPLLDGHPHGVQRLGTADQPGGGVTPGFGRLSEGPHRGPGPGARTPEQPAGLGSSRFRRHG
jgi:anthranilate phosphoribosyltransferase